MLYKGVGRLMTTRTKALYSPLTYQLLDEHAMLELLVGIAIRVKAEEVDELGIEQEGVAAMQRHLERGCRWCKGRRDSQGVCKG